MARIRDDRVGDQVLEEFGAFLFDRLLPGQLGTTYELSCKHIGNTVEQPSLRIMLNVLADELRSIPWELMYHRVRRQSLATHVRNPMSRYVDAPIPYTHLIAAPLRILICVAEPNDQPSVLSNTELSELKLVFVPLEDSGLAELKVLRNTHRSALQEKLEEFRPHVFHFVGHGQHHAGNSGLSLERLDGSSEFTRADLLCELLQPVSTVRLAVLNACDSQGVAFVLGRQGIAAIGMQHKIRSTAAVAFARKLYSRLTENAALDVAVNAARLEIRLQCSGNRKDWLLPVVFLPGGVPRVFDLTTPPSVAAQTAVVASQQAASTQERDSATEDSTPVGKHPSFQGAKLKREHSKGMLTAVEVPRQP